ncbi:hypothetical protein AG0111_0g8686 [Alternaria gaisen]|uniref:Uncharacterized protein n=1 Tax=Alternaria gaisen TaxID=167740 RepID=A0ACB6FED8_9PLEO|nr:hypothetical protein AG0111_0g8686 [Alternaria gaisen]
MTRLKRWKDRPQVGGLPAKNAASVIIVPGVSADALDKQTCYHFEELIKNWCAAPLVWIYDHSVQLLSPQSWDEFCDCGEDLLTELLSLTKQQPQREVVLIGHRLGVFILKKALHLAYRQKHREPYAWLFETLRTLVMIGEPHLGSYDRTQWPLIVRESLGSTKGSTPETFSADALERLKFIEEMFERLDINSQFFQVSGKPSKRKGLYRSKSKAKNCVCDGSVTVRMWTTQDDDKTVLEEMETSNRCIFSHKSGWHRPLGLITAGEWTAKEYSPPRITDVASSGPKSIVTERSIHSSVYHASALVTAAPEESVPPELRVQTTVKHTSAIHRNHVGEESHSTENNSPLITVHQDSGVISLTTSTSAQSHSDMIKEHTDLHLVSTDQGTLEDEEANRSTGASSMLSQGMILQSREDQSLSASATAQRNFVEVPNIARHRSRPLPLRLSLPPTCLVFFPREDAMTWLHSRLLQKPTGQEHKQLRSTTTTVGVLYGLGGVGKTQIALHFARSAESGFDAVFWLRADSEQSILRSFHDAAIALGLINGRKDYSHTQSAILCMKWLSESQARWLLVFDHVENAETITPYIPHSENGVTVITTRVAGLRFPPSISPISHCVQPLSFDDSLNFLIQCTHLELEEVYSQAGFELLQNFDGLPIALIQLASIIKRRQLSVQEFLSLWKEVKHREQSSKHEASRTFSGIWSIISDTLSPDARQLLAVLSYMDPDAARTSLVQAVFEKAIPLEDLVIVDDRLRAATEQLTNLALIRSVRQDEAFTIHRLIQDSMQSNISRDEKDHTLRCLTSVLGAQWPSDRKFRNVLHGFWAEFDDIINQFRRVVDQLSPMLTVIDSLDDVVDESFTRTALRCVWYDRRVRGNNSNYANLAHFATAAIALPRQRLKDTSRHIQRTSYMPKRLLMIDHQLQRWQLVDTGGRKLSYMAFSLNFSDDESGPVLTKQNLRTFQEGVALARMPKAFRAACLFSGMLLTKYLWIDSTCIDQNDDEEKASAVRHISEIYQNAALIISLGSQQKQKLPYGQVKWGRYDLLCGENSTSKRLCLLQDCFTKTDSLQSLASTIAPEVLSNVEPYVQGNGDVLSDSGPPLVFDTPASLTGLKAHPLSERSTETSNDGERTPTEEPLPSEERNGDTNRVAHTIAVARLCINEGIKHYAQKNMLRTVTKLVQARELVRTTQMSSPDASRVDLQAAIYLARTFLIDRSAEAAMDLLSNIEVPEEISESRESESAIIMAQLRIVKGDAYIASGNAADASNTYRENIDAIDEDQEGDIADLAAISKLRLSNCNMAQSDWRGAHALIKEVITHFEEQDSKQGQAQYARALYHQAVLYKGENKEKFRKRSMAAARQALEDLCEEHDLDVPATNRELERDDFETVIELGFL